MGARLTAAHEVMADTSWYFTTLTCTLVDECIDHTIANFEPEGRPLQGPLFPVHQNAAAPLSKRTMLGRLHRALAAEGYPSNLFGLHSLRSGGATAASAAGVPERLIKIQGRWVSDVVRLYTCALPSERWQVSAAMQACTD